MRWHGASGRATAGPRLVRWDAVAPQQAATQGESHLGAGSSTALVFTGGHTHPGTPSERLRPNAPGPSSRRRRSGAAARRMDHCLRQAQYRRQGQIVHRATTRARRGVRPRGADLAAGGAGQVPYPQDRASGRGVCAYSELSRRAGRFRQTAYSARKAASGGSPSRRWLEHAPRLAVVAGVMALAPLHCRRFASRVHPVTPGSLARQGAEGPGGVAP
jgi:hypothetical protein